MSSDRKPWADRGSTSSRGYGAAWSRIRKRIVRRDCGLCQPCLREGIVTPFRDVDHIVPKARGGTDDDSNLECICGECHDAKSAAERGERPKVRYGLDGWPT